MWSRSVLGTPPLDHLGKMVGSHRTVVSVERHNNAGAVAHTVELSQSGRDLYSIEHVSFLLSLAGNVTVHWGSS